jgi:hypothetical protein
MTYRGHIQNGMVVLDEPAQLTEGARVRIEILEETQQESLHPEILRYTDVLPENIDVRGEYAEGMVKKHT